MCILISSLSHKTRKSIHNSFDKKKEIVNPILIRNIFLFLRLQRAYQQLQSIGRYHPISCMELNYMRFEWKILVFFNFCFRHFFFNFPDDFCGPQVLIGVMKLAANV